MMQSTHSADSDATEKFGEQLGHRLRGGEIIELVSDLGGGKTTLTRGIVRGAGSHDVVSSPTFTISKVYACPHYDIHHYDFYRLGEAGLMEHELYDLFNDPRTILIIEWSDVVQQVLPKTRLTITLKKTTHDNSREIICTYAKELEYLVKV